MKTSPTGASPSTKRQERSRQVAGVLGVGDAPPASLHPRRHISSDCKLKFTQSFVLLFEPFTDTGAQLPNHQLICSVTDSMQRRPPASSTFCPRHSKCSTASIERSRNQSATIEWDQDSFMHAPACRRYAVNKPNRAVKRNISEKSEPDWRTEPLGNNKTTKQQQQKKNEAGAFFACYRANNRWRWAELKAIRLHTWRPHRSIIIYTWPTAVLLAGKPRPRALSRWTCIMVHFFFKITFFFIEVERKKNFSKLKCSQ